MENLQPAGLPRTGVEPERHGDALNEAHREHLMAEWGDRAEEGLAIALDLGARSLSPDEAHEMGFRFKGWRGGGLLMPFSDGFAQLRCDDPPVGPDGQPVRYLNRAGTPQRPVTVGDGEPTLATEGFKDAIALHLLTGETVQGVPGVSCVALLAPTVTRVCYDADGQLNPGVWTPLIRSGLAVKGRRIAYLPAGVCGAKGGFSEFLRAGGDFTSIQWRSAREMLRTISDGWDRSLRADWQERSLRSLARLAVEAGMGRTAAEQLAATAAKRIGLPVKNARSIASRAAKPKDGAASCPAEPTKQQLQQFIRGTYAVQLNELTGRVELNGAPMEGFDFADSFLAHQHGLEVTKQAARDAFAYVAADAPYNPVRAYFDGLRGRDDLRLLGLQEIAAAFGITPGDTLSQELLARHLAGAYLRGIEPGHKHDQMLLLLGDQGQGKGEAIRALAGPGWYDSATRVPKALEDREFLGKINSAWLFEFDEAEKTLLGRDAAELKGFLSRRADRYVGKWETVCREHSRRCVLFGSSNDLQVLNDSTGSRRFWIIDVRGGTMRPDWIREHRDSLWATVATWVEWGLRNWVPPNHPTAIAAAERAAKARLSHHWEGKIRKALEALAADGDGIGQDDLIEQALDLEIGKVSRNVQMDVGRIVTASDFATHGDTIRWKQQKRRYGGGQPRSGYVPVPVPSVPTCSEQYDGDWNGQMPWHDRRLTVPFQLFQPFKEVEEEEGAGGVHGPGEADACVSHSPGQNPQKGRNGWNAPETDCAATDLPFQRDRNTPDRSERRPERPAPSSRSKQRKQPKPDHRARVLAIAPGAPVEIREEGKPTVNGHRMLDPLGRSEHCQLQDPRGRTVLKPKSSVWPCGEAA